ncbi:uncharacterized protein LOC131219096 [Magnolia sinica]|uniref:uncharacterized protein LOC131219096 n=1 Tax=Magnolia sinica TaxID=86752 RepID=UPI00265B2F11|nr:uncharacterized protein LOC131219096 [Magnolia sinica]
MVGYTYFRESSGCLQHLGVAGFSNRSHPKQFSPMQTVYWAKPPTGWVKVNVDGSACGNLSFSGGGRICRRDDGSFVFAFSSAYGVGSNNQAELRAIYDGIVLCLDRGFSKIIVETDSMVAAVLLSGTSATRWKWKPWVARIKSFEQTAEFVFSAIPREGNGPVDGMAREASGIQASLVTSHYQDLPPHIRGLLFLDKVGLGAVRDTNMKM